MENIHVRFEYVEAVAGRKEFLYSEINLLETLKRLKNYKSLRKRELILKSRFRRELASLMAKFGEIGELFPKETTEIDVTKEEFKEPEETKEIETQLQEIKEKLIRLEAIQ